MLGDEALSKAEDALAWLSFEAPGYMVDPGGRIYDGKLKLNTAWTNPELEEDLGGVAFELVGLDVHLERGLVGRQLVFMNIRHIEVEHIEAHI